MNLGNYSQICLPSWTWGSQEWSGIPNSALSTSFLHLEPRRVENPVCTLPRQKGSWAIVFFPSPPENMLFSYLHSSSLCLTRKDLELESFHLGLIKRVVSTILLWREKPRATPRSNTEQYKMSQIPSHHQLLQSTLDCWGKQTPWIARDQNF